MYNGLAVGLRWGLSLWNSVAGTIAVEALLLAAGIWVYLKCTTMEDKAGQWGLWTLCGLMAVVFIAIFLIFPPKTEGVVPNYGLIQLLFVAGGYWLESHRKSA
jgi:hypothetical protein